MSIQLGMHRAICPSAHKTGQRITVKSIDKNTQDAQAHPHESHNNNKALQFSQGHLQEYAQDVS